jgi:hypothetical protein
MTYLKVNGFNVAIIRIDWFVYVMKLPEICNLQNKKYL